MQAYIFRLHDTVISTNSMHKHITVHCDLKGTGTQTFCKIKKAVAAVTLRNTSLVG